MLDLIVHDDRFLTLYVSNDALETVKEELLPELRAVDIPAEIPPQGGGNPIEEVVGFIEIGKDAVALAKVAAKSIIAWRRRANDRSVSTRIRIQRPGKSAINLEIATEEEITIYITDERTSTR